jgi:hypothetical protein
MLAKTPDERPSLADVRQVITELREGATPATQQPQRRALPTVLIGGMLFLAGVITVGVIALVNKKDSSSPSTPVAASQGSAVPTAGSATTPQAAVVPDPQPAPPVTDVAAGSGDTPMIEFDDDKLHKTKRPTTPTEAVVTPDAGAPVPAKPPVGNLVLILELASSLEIDGKVIAEESRGGRFELPVGQHTVKVKAAGREALTRTIDIEASGTTVMRIGDDPGTPKPAPPKPEGEGSAAPPAEKAVPQP